MGISERVKELRNNYLHLSQNAFGERVGVSRDVINNIELNRLAKPEQKISLLKLICKEFNVNEEWLLNGQGPVLIEDDIPQIVEFAKQQGATDLEMRFIKAYFSLEQDVREKVMNFIIKQVLDTTNLQTEKNTQQQVIPTDHKHFNELSKEEHLQLYAEYLDIEEKVEEKSEVSQNDILKSS